MPRVAIIVLAPVLLRAALVPFVDDFDADGYSRVLIAQRLADALHSGTFDWGLLYIPAWMPAWHLLCAIVQLAVPEPYYVPKFLSALFGGLSPGLVFLTARRLAGTESAGWTAWAIAALLPLHLLYSATAMTEAFTGFWILLAAYSLLRAEQHNLWLLASAAALLPAALTRYETWVLLPLLPALGVLQRRAKPQVLALSAAISALGPLIWMAITFNAAGNPLAFFGSHESYITHLFEFHPDLADRGLLGLAQHLGSMALAASLTVTALGLYGLAKAPRRDRWALGALLATQLGFMFFLWALHLQVGYMRHYMTTGLLMTAAVPLALQVLPYKRAAVAVLATEMSVLALAHGGRAFWSDRLRETAAFLRRQTGTVYCDEPGVQVLSRLPPDRFAGSFGMERTVPRAFGYLREKGVRWVVYVDADYSPLPELFPALRQGAEVQGFRLAYRPESNRQGLPAIRVYEFSPGDFTAKGTKED